VHYKVRQYVFDLYFYLQNEVPQNRLKRADGTPVICGERSKSWWLNMSEHKAADIYNIKLSTLKSCLKVVKERGDVETLNTTQSTD